MADQFEYKSGQKNKTLSNFIIPSVLGLGTGLRAGSAMVSGESAVSAARYNSKAINEEIANLGFSNEISQKQYDRQIRMLQGQQTTAVSTSGLAMSGSIVDLLADSAAQAKLQSLFQQQAVQAQQAKLEREKEIGAFRAKQARKGSYLQAFGELGKGFVNIMERK